MAPKKDILQNPKKEGVEVTVKYIKPFFVETDEANFKAVVQSLTGQDSPAPILNNTHSNISLSTLEHDFLQERENVNVAVVNVKEMEIEGESLYCMPSFVGFETGMFDSFSDDLGFQNCNDAFELPPSTISDLDMSWDSSLWSDGMSFSI